MAAVPVTIVGIDGNGNPTTIVGMMSYTGLGVGGGPIIPPSGGDGKPPSIWPSPGHPEHPIVIPPPNGDGGKPPQIWPSPGRPSHPIVLPPVDALPTPPGDKPPPADGGWGYYDGRWGYFPGPGQASPKG